MFEEAKMKCHTHILSIVNEAINQRCINHLMVNEHNELQIAAPGVVGRIQRFFDFGNYAPSTLTKFFKNHLEQIKQEAQEYVREGHSIVATSQAIERICLAANVKVLDLNALVLPDWMGLLPNKQVPLHDILVPGTIHSAVDCMESSAFLSEDWLVHQNQSITSQLEHGIRWFDIQYAYESLSRKFYITNQYHVSAMDFALLELRVFVHNHPTEVICVNLNADAYYGRLTREHNHELAGLLTRYFSGVLSDNGAYENQPINTLVENGTNLMLFTENTDDQVLPQYQQVSKAHVSPGIEPDTTHYIFFRSLETLAKVNNRELNAVIESNAAHIIAMDFPSAENIETVILHNFNSDTNSYF